MKTRIKSPVDGLASWASRFAESPEAILNVDGAVAELAAAAVAASAGKPVAVLFPTAPDAVSFAAVYHKWTPLLEGSGENPVFVPELESDGRFAQEHPVERAKAVRAALDGEAKVFVGSAAAFMATVPPPAGMAEEALDLSRGDRMDPSALAARLVEMDYDDEEIAAEPGEFSRRGGILDVFSVVEDLPARIEFFGDEIESIRLYDPISQRTVRGIDAYDIAPKLREAPGDAEYWNFLDYFPDGHPLLVAVFPSLCAERLALRGDRRQQDAWEELLAGENVVRLLDVVESAETEGTELGAAPAVDDPADPAEPGNESPAGYAEWRAERLASAMNGWLAAGYAVFVSGSARDVEEHVRQWCRERGVDPDRVAVSDAPFPSGVVLPDAEIAVLTEKELFSTTPHHHAPPPLPVEELKTAAFQSEAAPEDFPDLEPGDFATHLEYGVCVYHGLSEVESGGVRREMIKLEFANDLILHVPLSQANLIAKYVGAAKNRPKLDVKGGKRWLASKAAAARSVKAMALDLLRVQAARLAARSQAFPPDDLWQKVFDESFPLPETPDQAKAAGEVKNDMASPRPMDRLLCGDVGFGKTEVAMRAAFKAVSDGRQVAVMAPTTILAQQHFYSFKDRFAEHPVIIDTLSRFRSRKERRDILERLADGRIDIIIGTHCLAQKEVRFANLGLLVVDEEQRFGVLHKEWIKRLKTDVDVLTMTATPIPRTLHMALGGLRDLSVLRTPPGGRLPVRTRVCVEDPAIIAGAIRDELARGGQAYYLHNRVKTIEKRMEDLRALVPEARFAVAHGRMDENELESVMGRFLDGKIDVLVCTTIIESGIDVPNANTIVIERADRFGLATLHQLRGRVGRWRRQAKAFLLLPKHGIMTGDARKRLAAIRRHTELGAGFRLAMRDLEIRGVGNILGAKQSGHVSAIGFELYCQLLKNTVAEIRGDRGAHLRPATLDLDFLVHAETAPKGKIPAAIPAEYVPAEKQRLSFHKRVANAFTPETAAEIAEELRDRFGPLPEPVSNLLAAAEIAAAAGSAGWTRVKVAGNAVAVSAGNVRLKAAGKNPEIPDGLPPERKLEAIKKILFEALAKDRR